MSFTKKVKTFFVVPTSLFAFRSPDPTRSVSAGLRRQRPVLLSWFLLSCVAGALADAKRRRRRDLAAAERKLRTLEELIGEERAGTAGDRPETRKRLRAVGVGRREDMAAWEDERRALERAEAERRAKLGFWKRYFGSTTAGEESDVRVRSSVCLFCCSSDTDRQRLALALVLARSSRRRRSRVRCASAGSGVRSLARC